MRFALHNIAQANIDRFETLLQTETEPAKRTMLVSLLAEEKEKLREFKRREKESDLPLG